MKLKLWIFAATLALATLAHGATNDLTVLLQKGLFEEEANRDLTAAIANYQSLANAFDKDRQLAVTAIFRLGECYRKLGKTNEAVAEYQRILKEFGDQQTLVTLSRQNLTGLNAAAASPMVAANESSVVGAEANVASLQAQLEAIEKMSREQRVIYVQQNFPNPVLTSLIERLNGEEIQLMKNTNAYPIDAPELKPARDEIGSLKQKIDLQVEGVLEGLRVKLATAQTLRKRQSDTQISSASGAESAVTDEEQQEIRRIQLMIQNSPDLINAPDSDGNTPLILATAKGQLVVAKYLLDHGADVNARSKHNGVPLSVAAENGHKAMVELLLSRGADVNGSGVRNPLYVAIVKGYVAVAEVLMTNKADVNTSYFGGLVNAAAGNSQIELLNQLIQHGADVNQADGNGRTPLENAAARNDTNAVKLLLAAKASVEAKDKEGNTPLHEAARAGNRAAMTLLLDAGAAVDATNKYDGTPLLLAINARGLDAVRLLLQHKADPNRAGTVLTSSGGLGGRWQPVSLALNRGDNDILKLLLDAGGSAETDSPLFSAIGNNNAESVRLLLDHGADPNRPDKDGVPPLIKVLSTVKNKVIVQLLLDKGADANAKANDSNKSVPLFLTHDPEIGRLLVDHKADVDARMVDGITCLMYAYYTNYEEFLIAAGAKLDLQDTNGNTALHYMAYNPGLDSLAVLLEHKANPNIQNEAGFTPLDLANNGLSGRINSGMWSTRSIPSPVNAELEKKAVDLLMQAGGLANLPKRDRIELRRASNSGVAFTKGSHDWNRYSLLEMIAAEYDFLNQKGAGAWDRHGSARSTMWDRNFPFPDFKNVIIYRRTDISAKQKAIYVDVESVLDTGDCSKDILLEWGDVVEIPEADHPIDQHWPGLTDRTITALTNCTARQIVIVINGVSTPVRLSPQFAPQYPTHIEGQSDFPMLMAHVSFMLRSVLDNSKLVRVSSDLTRVKVTRVDPETKKKQEWTIDCTKLEQADLWLRDGDVIDVPEK